MRVALKPDEGWKPRRHGDVFCSPRCGGGCTYAAYERACAEGAALAAKMGQGWKREVWENLGWHYKVSKGCAHIHPTIRHGTRGKGWKVVGYTCYFNSAHQYLAHSRSPHAALRKAIKQAASAAYGIIDDCRTHEAV